MSVCQVCAHPLRTVIDQRLAAQVVNISALADEYGVPRRSMSNHRDNHLSEFLRVLVSRAQLFDLETLNAEATRLYMTTMDALAKAERGVLISSRDKDGMVTERYAVSQTAVARFIREARQGITLLAKLSADRVKDSDNAPTTKSDNALTARMEAALSRVLERGALGDGHTITDANIIDMDDDVGSRVGEMASDVTNEAVTYGGTWSGQAGAGSRANTGLLPEDAPISNLPVPFVPTGQSSPTAPGAPDREERLAQLEAEYLEERDRILRQDRSPELKTAPWPGSLAASAEERAYEGYGTLAVKRPDRPANHRAAQLGRKIAPDPDPRP